MRTWAHLTLGLAVLAVVGIAARLAGGRAGAAWLEPAWLLCTGAFTLCAAGYLAAGGARGFLGPWPPRTPAGRAALAGVVALGLSLVITPLLAVVVDDVQRFRAVRLVLVLAYVLGVGGHVALRLRTPRRSSVRR
ncbi:MAG TPA: hypothetical protein VGD67_10270 [Pseudonocardiaceae bacterium]